MRPPRSESAADTVKPSAFASSVSHSSCSGSSSTMRRWGIGGPPAVKIAMWFVFTARFAAKKQQGKAKQEKGTQLAYQRAHGTPIRYPRARYARRRRPALLQPHEKEGERQASPGEAGSVGRRRRRR